MEKSILIVGGTGVISFAIAQEAIKQGISVTCINRGQTKNQKLDDNVEVIKADYRDRKLMEEKLRNRHFGAVLDVLCYKKEDIDYSITLFRTHCDQYLFFSSAEVYNKKKYENVKYNEDVDLINPLWSYSINKAECEEELIKLAKKYNIIYTIVRPAITYGNTRIPYGVMPAYGYHGTIIKRLLYNKPIILWDEGKHIATITRVEDFAIGFVGLLGNFKAFNQAFHISGDESFTWKDVIESLACLLNVTPAYFNISSSCLAEEMPSLKEQIIGGRAISQRLDNSKIKDAVPTFRTNISLKDGIKKSVEYYQMNNYLLGIDYRFDASWDRIIKKYAPSKYLHRNNIRFIDYLNNASIRDRLIYYLEFYKDSLLLRMMKYVKNLTYIF